MKSSDRWSKNSFPHQKNILQYFPLAPESSYLWLQFIGKTIWQPGAMVYHPRTVYLDVEIVDEGVIFRDIVENEDGTFTEVEGSDTLVSADSVIISISQGPLNAIVSTTSGLETNSRGLLIADECGRTSRPGIFASGDVVNGARTVVEAVAYSKRVAEAMHEYIQGNLEAAE